MSHSRLLDQLRHAIELAQFCERENISTSEGLERREESTHSRRKFLAMAGAASFALSPMAAFATRKVPGPRIAIIGGGLAGLACADRLQIKGYLSTIYEAGSRVGGRCFSNRTLVPGMACENGGEFIDTGHKMMLAYANEFGLAKESVIKQAGDERYYFAGQNWTEAQVVDELRIVLAGMQADVRSISGSASFYSSNQADIDLDNTDLASYLDTRCDGHPLIRRVLDEAYVSEYGTETSQQSSLNFLSYMRFNKQSKFEPFGTSDERFHLTNGNDGIVAGLEAKALGPIRKGARLTRISKNIAGEYLLYFNGSTVPEKADVVVLAIPFTVLRGVQIDPQVGFSGDKTRAIQTMGYGTNAKTMVAFNGRYWATQFGSNGGALSDLANVQNVWETNRANSASKAIMTDYASGTRGAGLRTNLLQSQVNSFLNDLNVVFPGIKATAAKSGTNYVAHLEHWPTNPNSLGSYTSYKPGQFTGIEGLNSEASGFVKFAGEHADSFYMYQGFMEGACQSGLRAANEVLADIKAGRI
jgi:monoamine oxidase